jgi:hypothetical protein
MNDERLDNVIWNALTTEHAELGERVGDAARFSPEVTGLAGFRVYSRGAHAALAMLVAPGDLVRFAHVSPLGR